MAGTIIATPAVGASDWSGWITQQGATDTGYMRVSLTNFNGTAVSAIATGSVMECAGSIYSFTETAMSLAAGTPSASQAIYFTVVPAAGGTTCTIVMEGTAPTWVDSKQGFYLSAASLTRVIGGCYIGTAATYFHKWIYTPEAINYCLAMGKTRPILKEKIDIGDWDMAASNTTIVMHDYTSVGTILNAIAMIRNDDALRTYRIDQHFGAATSGTYGGGMIATIRNGQFDLVRLTGGFFDSTDFNSTSFNRGWIFVTYEA